MTEDGDSGVLIGEVIKGVIKELFEDSWYYLLIAAVLILLLLVLMGCVWYYRCEGAGHLPKRKPHQIQPLRNVVPDNSNTQNVPGRAGTIVRTNILLKKEDIMPPYPDIPGQGLPPPLPQLLNDTAEIAPPDPIPYESHLSFLRTQNSSPLHQIQIEDRTPPDRTPPNRTRTLGRIGSVQQDSIIRSERVSSQKRAKTLEKPRSPQSDPEVLRNVHQSESEVLRNVQFNETDHSEAQKHVMNRPRPKSSPNQTCSANLERNQQARPARHESANSAEHDLQLQDSIRYLNEVSGSGYRDARRAHTADSARTSIADNRLTTRLSSSDFDRKIGNADHRIVRTVPEVSLPGRVGAVYVNNNDNNTADNARTTNNNNTAYNARTTNNNNNPPVNTNRTFAYANIPRNRDQDALYMNTRAPHPPARRQTNTVNVGHTVGHTMGHTPAPDNVFHNSDQVDEGLYMEGFSMPLSYHNGVITDSDESLIYQNTGQVTDHVTGHVTERVYANSWPVQDPATSDSLSTDDEFMEPEIYENSPIRVRYEV